MGEGAFLITHTQICARIVALGRHCVSILPPKSWGDSTYDSLLPPSEADCVFNSMSTSKCAESQKGRAILEIRRLNQLFVAVM